MKKRTDEEILTEQGFRNLKRVDGKLYGLRPEDGDICLYSGLCIGVVTPVIGYDAVANHPDLKTALAALAKIQPKPPSPEFDDFGGFGG